jgi:hypothetical protein
MKQMEPILDQALSIMQGTAKHLQSVCKDYLGSGKALNTMSMKEHREVLEAIAEGLDQDSLLCQDVMDKAKKEDVEGNEPSDVAWPLSLLELDSEDCMTIHEHFETF